jgi:hypothetical protein
MIFVGVKRPGLFATDLFTVVFDMDANINFQVKLKSHAYGSRLPFCSPPGNCYESSHAYTVHVPMQIHTFYHIIIEMLMCLYVYVTCHLADDGLLRKFRSAEVHLSLNRNFRTIIFS